MPENVIVPRRREDFFMPNGDPTLRFIRFLESLTGATNENTTIIVDNSDAIAELAEDSIKFSDAIIGVDADEIAQDYQDDFTYQYEPIKWNAVSVQSGYTMNSWDFVNAKLNAVITFPLYPDEGDGIVVRNGDGSRIKLIGNGRNINGSSTGLLQRKSTSIEFYYFINDNEWLAK